MKPRALSDKKAVASKFRHKDFIKDKAALDNLILAIKKYCVKMQHLDLPESVADKLPKTLRVVQYFQKLITIVDDVSKDHALLNHQIPGTAAATARNFRREVRDILNVAHTPCAPEFAELEKLLKDLHIHYNELKESLLLLGAQGRIDLNQMVALLDYYSRMRVMCEQAAKGTTHWAMLRDIDITCSTATENNDYAWKPEE